MYKDTNSNRNRFCIQEKQELINTSKIIQTVTNFSRIKLHFSSTKYRRSKAPIAKKSD